MSLQDAMTAVERSLDDLIRSVGKLETQLGAGLDIRRVRTDTDHLRESLTLLKQSVAAAPPPTGARPTSRWCRSPTPPTTPRCGPTPRTRASAPGTATRPRGNPLVEAP